MVYIYIRTFCDKNKDCEVCNSGEGHSKFLEQVTEEKYEERVAWFRDMYPNVHFEKKYKHE